MRRLAAGVLLALALGGCLQRAPALPPEPVAAGAGVRVDAQAVPLDPTDPARDRIGRFAYAGGLWLTSRQTSRLHGFSDLKVWPDGRLLALGDQSDLMQGRLVLDRAGRLVGVADAKLTALKDEAGVDLYAGGQREFDTEGVAILGNGDMVVSFEQHDRVFVYPKAGGPPRPAPMPRVRMTFNKGMEALAAAPEIAPDAYRVGLEDSGWTFLCRVSTECLRDRDLDLEGSELVAMEPLPSGGLAYLLRSYSAARGSVIRLKVMDRAGRAVDTLELSRPLTVDNLEGLAAVPRPGGGLRFYLVSDDNFGAYAGLPTDQRTLLLAFDWTPPGR